MRQGFPCSSFFSFLVFLTLFLFSSILSNGQSSVLSSGEWHKLQVQERSVYRITGKWLRDRGIDWTGVASNRLAVYASEEGMLPQANAAERSFGLRECAIQVADGGDGRFDANDYLLFWGVAADKLVERQTGFYEMETNLYSQESFFYLHLKESGTTGKRVVEVSFELPQEVPPVTETGTAVLHHESEILKPVTNSGRKWYGEQFAGGFFTLGFNLPQAAAGEELKIHSALLKRSANAAQIQLTANGSQVGVHDIGGHTVCQYCVQGIEDDRFFSAPYSGGEQLRLEWKGSGTINLDFAAVNYRRELALEEKAFEFVLGGPALAKVRNSNSSAQVWDVTDLHAVRKMGMGTYEGRQAFITTSESWKSYFLFTPEELPSPDYVSPVANQNLKGDLSPQMVVIYHSDFKNEALDFVSYRRGLSGLNIKAADIEQVYNEFSGGRMDVSAVRDYMRYLYKQGGQRLKYLFLIGRSSFDYRGLTKNPNVAVAPFVPSYESYNSLDPVFSYVSDDYFGLLEDSEGEWHETGSHNETLEIAVGRLPATDSRQVKYFLEKLKAYESDQALGSWNQNVVLIADDGDNNSHTRSGELLSERMLAGDPSFKVNKIYLDAVPQIEDNGDGTSPEAVSMIRKAVEKGAFMVNYIGHGREDQLAHEGIVTHESIDTWLNKNRYPIFVTATCQFGRHDDPFQSSGAERILFRRKAGGVALVTTSRPVYNTSNERLNVALYEAMFEGRRQGKTLGEVFVQTKNNALSGVGNRNFILLGDPSMAISKSRGTVRLTRVNETAAEEQLPVLQALEPVAFQGKLVDEAGAPLAGFNGGMVMELVGEPVTRYTKGYKSSPYPYHRENVFYRGIVSVRNGVFSQEVTLPKDIGTEEQSAFIRFSATDTLQGKYLTGSFGGLRLGGVSADAQDSDPPAMLLKHAEGTPYQKGMHIQPIADWRLSLQDESGINISESDESHSLKLIIDDSETVFLNEDFFNNGEGGEVRFRTSLTLGSHQLKIQAWDLHNNMNEKIFNVQVTDLPELDIEEVSVYPNPVKSEANLTFEHNREGDDLEVNLKVLSIQGGLLYEKDWEFAESRKRIDEIDIDLRKQVQGGFPSGVYVYQLLVKSASDSFQKKYFGRIVVKK
ncbi:MAG: type IX secretion system sortase PorU [Cytophagales bacterium]|nr:type IX secretion system sortase PorU [Cytophagales bacterium]